MSELALFESSIKKSLASPTLEIETEVERTFIIILLTASGSFEKLFE